MEADMSFQIGEAVRYIPGYRGWHDATVIGYDAVCCQYIIELSNGKELCVYGDELEWEE